MLGDRERKKRGREEEGNHISMNRRFSGVGCVARFINQYIFVPMMGFRLSSRRVSS